MKKVLHAIYGGTENKAKQKQLESILTTGNPEGRKENSHEITC